MAIDSIAAATSPLLTGVGFSGLAGFLIGYAIKHVMKFLAVGAGILFAALMYFQQQGIVSVNWDKLQTVSQNAVSILANATGQLSHTSTPISSANFALPITGAAALGFAIGLLR